MEHVQGAAIAANTAGGQTSLMVMACGICDVMWRGRHGDDCWACGHSAHTMKAPPLQVKVPAPA